MKPSLEILAICDSDLSLPKHETEFSAGVDLRANIPQPLVLDRFERVLIPTGLKVQIPDGYEAQVRPRSGLAFKHGITVLNSPGTIDSDYRGEIKVLLINLGSEPYTVEHGDRVAQMVVANYEKVRLKKVEVLSDTERGNGGYGSTGKG